MTPWSSSAQVLVAASGEVADCIHTVTTRLKNKVGVEPAKNCSFSNVHLRLSPKTRPLQPFSRNKHGKKDCLSLVYGHFLLHNNCREGWIYFIQKAQICHIISVNYLLNILTCCGVCFLRSEILPLMSHTCSRMPLTFSKPMGDIRVNVFIFYICTWQQPGLRSELVSPLWSSQTTDKNQSFIITDLWLHSTSLQQLI